MKRMLIKPLALAALVAACDAGTTEPTTPTDLRPSASAGATTEFTQFNTSVFFRPYASCFDAQVLVSGPITFSVWTVTRPDGGRHITQILDVSNVTITYDGAVWTAGPNASEMFVRNVPAGGTIGLDEQQIEHQGTVIFRSPEGRPDLLFVHRIHLVRLPDGDTQLNYNIFEINCIAANN